MREDGKKHGGLEGLSVEHPGSCAATNEIITLAYKPDPHPIQ